MDTRFGNVAQDENANGESNGDVTQAQYSSPPPSTTHTASKKKCPRCLEEIQAAALVCKHCGLELRKSDAENKLFFFLFLGSLFSLWYWREEVLAFWNQLSR